jgi:hypothetical protein
MTLRTKVKSDLQLLRISSQYERMIPVFRRGIENIEIEKRRADEASPIELRSSLGGLLALLLLLGGGLLHASTATTPAVVKPFWQSKPRVFERVVEQREIVVLVANEKSEKPPSVLRLQGGGYVRQHPRRVFSEVQNYHSLKDLSDYVREVRFDAEKQQVFLHTEAFGYHARMTMKVTPEELPGSRRLHFVVVEGNFKGMTGAFTFEDFKSGQTLMGFDARYEHVKLPMPAFFVEFGLEVILQKMAGRMRTFLEKASAT